MALEFTIDSAIGRMQGFLREDLMVVLAIWTGIGWYVALQSRSYVRSRNIFDRVLGASYLVMDQGQVVALSTREHWAIAVCALASECGNAHLLEPWVKEEAQIHDGV